MESKHNNIRIYVACLAAYNNGQLHGAWIDADQSADAVMDEIKAMLRASPVTDAEEYAIHDHEGFEGYPVSEYEGIEQLCEIAAFISEHGRLGGALIEHLGDLEGAQDALRDHYAGCYDTPEDFARELIEQTQDVPEALAAYIDYEAMACDLLISDVFAIDTNHGETHIFWSH